MLRAERTVRGGGASFRRPYRRLDRRRNAASLLAPTCLHVGVGSLESRFRESASVGHHGFATTYETRRSINVRIRVLVSRSVMGKWEKEKKVTGPRRELRKGKKNNGPRERDR